MNLLEAQLKADLLQRGDLNKVLDLLAPSVAGVKSSVEAKVRKQYTDNPPGKEVAAVFVTPKKDDSGKFADIEGRGMYVQVGSTRVCVDGSAMVKEFAAVQLTEDIARQVREIFETNEKRLFDAFFDAVEGNKSDNPAFCVEVLKNRAGVEKFMHERAQVTDRKGSTAANGDLPALIYALGLDGTFIEDGRCKLKGDTGYISVQLHIAINACAGVRHTYGLA